MRFSSIAAVALIAASLSARAADDSNPWVEVASGKERTYSMEKGTFYVTTTKSGREVGVVRGQIYEKAANNYSYHKWYVERAACVDGAGKVAETDAAGNFVLEFDFNRKGNSVGAGIADMLCTVWERSEAADTEKSI